MEPRDTLARFEGFVHRTAGRYHSLARSYLHDPHEAEDVVQSAFLKTWRAWRDLQEDPGLDAWVARIVRNECIDRWRHNEMRRRFEERSARERRVREDAAPGASPGDSLADDGEARDLDRVRRLIRETPEPYRSVLVLRFVEKLSYKEIARELRKPLGTVKTTLCRAVRLIRLELHRD